MYYRYPVYSTKTNMMLNKKTFLLYLFSGIVSAHAADPVVSAILHDVNEYRQRHGFPALTLREDISREATRHSQDMATHRMPFGHNDFMKRVQHIYANTSNPRGAAENVAYNYRDGHDVVKNWLTSPHHLANIRGAYQETGIGIARDQNGKIYFTQLFLAKR
jgi:uncharacterized protein YkwD